MTRRKQLAMIAALLLTSATPLLAAGTTTVSFSSSGWWDQSGGHQGGNVNYFVGDCGNGCSGGELRDFFVFDLSQLGAQILSADFRVYNPSSGSDGGNGYISPDATETYQLFDVTTPIAQLTPSGSGQTAIFADLGSGTSYGSRVFSAADNGTTATINLNAAAVSALNAARGSQFALGGALASIVVDSTTEAVFAYSGSNSSRVRELVLTTTCGNGAVDSGEVCDDGNTNDGDGCNRFCKPEQCWSCNGASPTTCTPTDGVACDDGVFCNGVDVCSAGVCNHPGNPCTGGATCNTQCNEATDDCFNYAGSGCTDDGNTCTSDQCDGMGTCAHAAQAAGFVCRAAVDDCDLTETCDGTTAPCPADQQAPDVDGDMLCGDSDNCATVANPDQLDSNIDGIGDACSPQVSIDSIGASGNSIAAAVTAQSPLMLPLAGTVALCDGPAIDALTFTWLATSCSNPGDTLELVVNGAVVATVAPDPGFTCDCFPGAVGSYAVPVIDVTPHLVNGANTFGIHKSNSGNGAALAWAYATVSSAGIVQRVPIYDAPGGNAHGDYDTLDVCTAGYQFAEVTATSSGRSLCNPVSSQSWSGTLPCGADLQALMQNHSYSLFVSASDGVVGAPAQAASGFARLSEATVLINGGACSDSSMCTTDACTPGGAGADSRGCKHTAVNCNDDNVCTQDSCVPASGCVNAPVPLVATCRDAGVSALAIKQNSDDDKDQLSWKWSKGSATDKVEFGDPTTTADYTLCLYDGSGLVEQADIPAATACAGGSPCWKATSKGYSLKDKSGSSDGITAIGLSGGEDKKAKASLKGKGSNLPDPVLPLTGTVTLQLHNSQSGICIGGSYAGDDISKNEAEHFKAKHTAP